MARSIRIVNESRKRTSEADEKRIKAIGQAIEIQLKDVAAAWGQYVWQVVDDANRVGFKIALLDDADVADALGYHDVDDTDGTPYARVFLDPIFDNNGTWLRGANSVSAVVSHEACEMIGDPVANHWTEPEDGPLVAQELCDPVESLTYEIKVRGRPVSVSNFVYPDWFNPFADPGAVWFDHLGLVEEPFAVAPGGYVIRRSAGRVWNEYGRRYPKWRRATKQSPGSRTFARHRAG
jgi:hypothetical protein